MLKKKIFTPGPTQVHPDVLKATISFDTYHRSAEFKSFHIKLVEKLKSVFLTKQNLHILTTSGTGALETAFINFCRPGDNVLYINQGRFGARWGAIAAAYGVNAAELKIPYSEAAGIEEMKNLNFDGINAVLLTHTETSTATLTDIQALSEYIKANSNALVIVDAVTSVGAIEFKMDDWNIDVAVSASQKGLMTQPGLAIIAYSNIAKKVMMDNPMKRYFFDLRKEIKSFDEGQTTWTPAVGLFYGIDKACDIILAGGIETKWNQTKEIAEWFRKDSVNNGFGIFSKRPSDSLTAITLPGGIPAGMLIRAMKDKYGVHMANGQAEMKDTIARVSHMGDIQLDDIKKLSSLLKEELQILTSSA
ncbi:MAG: alanine--glyoxylate aminotransferase family protein [Ignavibacteria bacterium]|nr:alanine--glyoxylate aminotransferase family protein [Ignavibacteria bacterium]